MNRKKLLIVGFGNIGRCVLSALPEYPDFKCVGIITRNPARVAEEVKDVPIFNLTEKNAWQATDADVAILCGGSKDDLPLHGPLFAEHFNTVCSFDTHAKIDDHTDKETGTEKEGYYHIMDKIAGTYCNTAMVCQGWDPGIFSKMRIISSACMGGAKAEGFYGLTESGGLSMGHSDALRTIDGVLDARQYTHAKPEAITLMRSGATTEFLPGDMHWRECLVVAEENADREKIKAEILSMPNYFEPFHTTVEFVDQGQLNDDMPHDGLVIAVAEHGVMEFRNQWNSNPRGTAGILLAYARAAVRFNEEESYGAFTPPEVPDVYLLEDINSFLKYI